MNYIDAHVHVWTADTLHYPLTRGYTREDMAPISFTPEELFKHCRPVGVDRINLIQMSFYGFDNSYMLDMIEAYKGTFVGTAVIDPLADRPDRVMESMAHRGVRAFRIHPRLSRQPSERWLRPPGYQRMFAAGAEMNMAMSCLINPPDLTELDRMCRQYPNTPVIIDHICRIGVEPIREAHVQALCNMARHPNVLLKVGAFYALGEKRGPYTDLGPLIERVVRAYGADRCMWESDCPFQVVGGHNYRDSIKLIEEKLAFLSPRDKEWLLWRTAEQFFFS